MSTSSMAPQSIATGLQHRTVWRWHFYAGLFCIPLVLWLSVTGTIFLFHPQIQRWLDRPYDYLAITHPATANAQVEAALSAVPGTTLDSFQLHTHPPPQSSSTKASPNFASTSIRKLSPCSTSTTKTTASTSSCPACTANCSSASMAPRSLGQ